MTSNGNETETLPDPRGKRVNLKAVLQRAREIKLKQLAKFFGRLENVPDVDAQTDTNATIFKKYIWGRAQPQPHAYQAYFWRDRGKMRPGDPDEESEKTRIPIPDRPGQKSLLLFGSHPYMMMFGLESPYDDLTFHDKWELVGHPSVKDIHSACYWTILPDGARPVVMIKQADHGEITRIARGGDEFILGTDEEVELYPGNVLKFGTAQVTYTFAVEARISATEVVMEDPSPDFQSPEDTLATAVIPRSGSFERQYDQEPFPTHEAPHRVASPRVHVHVQNYEYDQDALHADTRPGHTMAYMQPAPQAQAYIDSARGDFGHTSVRGADTFTARQSVPEDFHQGAQWDAPRAWAPNSYDHTHAEYPGPGHYTERAGASPVAEAAPPSGWAEHHSHGFSDGLPRTEPLSARPFGWSDPSWQGTSGSGVGFPGRALPSASSLPGRPFRSVREPAEVQDSVYPKRPRAVADANFYNPHPSELISNRDGLGTPGDTQTRVRASREESERLPLAQSGNSQIRIVQENETQERATGTWPQRPATAIPGRALSSSVSDPHEATRPLDQPSSSIIGQARSRSVVDQRVNIAGSRELAGAGGSAEERRGKRHLAREEAEAVDAGAPPGKRGSVGRADDRPYEEVAPFSGPDPLQVTATAQAQSVFPPDRNLREVLFDGSATKSGGLSAAPRGAVPAATRLEPARPGASAAERRGKAPLPAWLSGNAADVNTPTPASGASAAPLGAVPAATRLEPARAGASAEERRGKAPLPAWLPGNVADVNTPTRASGASAALRGAVPAATRLEPARAGASAEERRGKAPLPAWLSGSAADVNTPTPASGASAAPRGAVPAATRLEPARAGASAEERRGKAPLPAWLSGSAADVNTPTPASGASAAPRGAVPATTRLEPARVGASAEERRGKARAPAWSEGYTMDEAGPSPPASAPTSEMRGFSRGDASKEFASSRGENLDHSGLDSQPRVGNRGRLGGGRGATPTGPGAKNRQSLPAKYPDWQDSDWS
ncbi:hypothetical protein FVE85_1437 [Porphyridium purpureum]|uniref:Uncharacterized protein n=1 Tax=Porphyridium purpureum TaxID=35688 RepID=A0A5J4YWP8_PORPP|nr:hypothetical protein FVE85_1437 [Porphyridium purpureum]|eukprot:POR1956..scf209_3